MGSVDGQGSPGWVRRAGRWVLDRTVGDFTWSLLGGNHLIVAAVAAGTWLWAFMNGHWVWGLVLVVLLWGIAEWAVTNRAKRRQDLSPRPTDALPVVDDALVAFLEAWVRPAFEAARTVVETATGTPGDASELNQRMLDDAGRGWGAVNNVLNGYGGEPQAAFGEFYRGYQGLSTRILGAITSGRVTSADYWYVRWMELDGSFLSHLREFASTPDRLWMLAEVARVGWGEGVRVDLPAPTKAEPRSP